MKKSFFFILSFALVAASLPAITVQVDPVGGSDNGSSPFQTLGAAITAVQGADAGADTINLRTTGVHNLSAALNINVAAADGNLTIQRDPGDTGQAIVVLANIDAEHGQWNVAGGLTMTVNNVTFIPTSESTGANFVIDAGDGFQIDRVAATTGIATIDMNDVIFAANDGTDNPLGIDQNPADNPNSTVIGDDWVDYFPNTAGTLTNVLISHAGDEGMIVRGTALPDVGADVTVLGSSVISWNSGRAVQPAFGGSNDASVPKITMTGTPTERIRIFGNSLGWSGAGAGEPTLTLFNGDHVYQYVDIVDNFAAGIRADTDTLDSLSLDFVRVANNGNADDGDPANDQGIIFLFATGDLSSASITNSTFHDQKATGQAVEVDAAVSGPITIDFTDCIFSGFQDTISLETGNAATVNLTNCAVVTTTPFAMPADPFPGDDPDSQTNVVNGSPRYVSTTFDPLDPQNADFLRVSLDATDYIGAASGGGNLVGGNGLSLGVGSGEGGSAIVDGTLDAIYARLAVQTTQTQFGDANGNLLGGGGSEFDALYVTNDASNLYVIVTGNLEANGNTLFLFIDDTTNATGVTGALPNITSIDGLFDASGVAGTTLPDGFDADFGFTMKGFDNPSAGGSGTYDLVYGFANYRTSTGDPATNPGADITTNDTTNPAIVSDNTFTSLGTFQFGVDNSNSAGVVGGTAAADAAAAAAVTTGIEFSIPLSAVGSPAVGTDLCLFAGVNNGNADFWANQFLPGLPTPAGNLGNDPNLSSAGVNLSCATYTIQDVAAAAASWNLFE